MARSCGSNRGPFGILKRPNEPMGRGHFGRDEVSTGQTSPDKTPPQSPEPVYIGGCSGSLRVPKNVVPFSKQSIANSLASDLHSQREILRERLSRCPRIGDQLCRDSVRCCFKKQRLLVEANLHDYHQHELNVQRHRDGSIQQSG